METKLLELDSPEPPIAKTLIFGNGLKLKLKITRLSYRLKQHVKSYLNDKLQQIHQTLLLS